MALHLCCNSHTKHFRKIFSHFGTSCSWYKQVEHVRLIAKEGSGGDNLRWVCACVWVRGRLSRLSHDFEVYRTPYTTISWQERGGGELSVSCPINFTKYLSKRLNFYYAHKTKLLYLLDVSMRPKNSQRHPLTHGGSLSSPNSMWWRHRV